MEIKRFDENDRLSLACLSDGIIYLSGAVGDVLLDDFKSQAESLFRKIDESLKNYGSNKDNMISVRIYLRDINNFHIFNEIYEKWLKKNKKPARTCVGAELADKRWLVEMEVVAKKI